MVRVDTMEKERFRQPCQELWADCRTPTVEVTAQTDVCPVPLALFFNETNKFSSVFMYKTKGKYSPLCESFHAPQLMLCITYHQFNQAIYEN